jgi:putative oxidoreductase
MNRPEPSVAFAAATAEATSQPALLNRLVPYALSILRIMAGLMFLEHGMAKLFGFPPHGGVQQFMTFEWFAGAIEFTGGLLVALGLFTRPAALIMSGEMAIGYFMDHAPRSFFPLLNGGDSAVLYCFVFFYFIFAGAGPLGLDALIWRRRQTVIARSEATSNPACNSAWIASLSSQTPSAISLPAVRRRRSAWRSAE